MYPLGVVPKYCVSSCASGAKELGCRSSGGAISRSRFCDDGEDGTGGPSLVGRQGVWEELLRLCLFGIWSKFRTKPGAVCGGFRPLADSPSVLFPSTCDKLWPNEDTFGQQLVHRISGPGWSGGSTSAQGHVPQFSQH